MKSLAAKAVGATLFGIASAMLAVASTWSAFIDRPAFAGVLGAVVALGTGGPPIARSFSERSRLLTLSAQEFARHFTDRIRECLVAQRGGLNLDDVGVHFFIRRRRRFVLWRYEYIRYSRSAKPSRPPEPRHAVWREDWHSGQADGLVGIALERREQLQVDLMDDEHKEARQQTWDNWFRDRDPRALGLDWNRSDAPRRWFSAMWAAPVPAPDGSVIGVITLNVEREVSDGDERLRAADSPRLLQQIARDAGMGLQTVRL